MQFKPVNIAVIALALFGAWAWNRHACVSRFEERLVQAYRASNPLAGDSLAKDVKADLERMAKEHSDEACSEVPRIKTLVRRFIHDLL